MKKLRPLILSAIVAFTGAQTWAQNARISSVAITSGVVAVTERTAANTNPPVTNTNQPVYVGDTLAGLTFFNGNPGIDGLPASPTSGVLFTLTGAVIPGGAATDLHAFMGYGTLIGPPTLAATYNDVAPLLTAATTYAGLSFVEPNLFPGGPAPLKANIFYSIHHAVNGTDYLSAIVPATGGGSAVMDIKPMSWPGGVAGGPASTGTSGYFALAFAAPTPTGPYFANQFYYLRTDGASHTKFGYMIPALVSGSLDTLDLTTAVGSFGVGGYTTLAYSPTAFGGYAASQFYYLRQDTGPGGTGNTILGRIDTNPANRTVSDIANLGGVFRTLTYVFDATGTAPAWGNNQLFVAGAPRPLGAQSVSFAAVADKIVGAQFTVTPTASSGLDLVVTVVSGPATIVASGPTGITPSQRIFTVTTTGPGVVKLQASQAGSAAPFFISNMMQQSFNVLGLPSITSGAAAAASVNSAFSYTITATGDPILSYAATGLPVTLTLNPLTGVISGTPLAAGVINATVTATNATGPSLPAPLTITVAPAGVAPVVTSPIAAAATVGAAFSYNILATGAPILSYAASGLPGTLTLNTATGAIVGTPLAAGVINATVTATNSTGTSVGSTLTITVAAAGVAPIIINNQPSAAATVGAPFSYTIAASGSPASYSATGLPPGLALNTLTGAITGTPTAAGNYIATLTATNASGTGSTTLAITVAPTSVAPIITSPAAAPGTAGTPFVTYVIAATGLPTSYSATGLPAGLSLNPLTGAINGTPTAAGTSVVTIQATNTAGTSTATVTITVGAAATAPTITSPATAGGTVGAAFNTYVIAATGQPTSYSATGLPAGLSIATATGAITGTPTVSGTFVVTVGASNATGTTTAEVTIVIAPEPVVASSRIVNFSARALSGPGNETLIMGFVVAGDGKNLLVRGIGPGLAAHGVVNVLADPMLTLFGAGGTIATNDDWQTTAAGQANATLVATTAARVGAFALPNASKDSALLATFNNGAHTTSMVRPNSTTGVALTEIYDTDITTTSRLINVSARMNVTIGEGTLIAGFVIAGNTAKTVLIRGVGPTLSAFGVTGLLADPTITLFNGATVVATNDNWSTGDSTAAQLTTASAQVGAFVLVAGSRDAALLQTLQPGIYTVQVTGVGGTTGVALLEIYDTQ